MRKTLLLLLAVALTATTARSQDLDEVADSMKQAMKHGNLKEKVGTMKGAFASKAATAEEIVGTWTYVEPAVLATSGKLLFKLIGNTFADELEDMIRDYFERANVTPQNTSITFRQDGTFQRSVVNRKAKGIWMVGDEQVLLGINNVQTAALHSHLENDTLTLVVPVQRIMSALQALGGISDSKTNKTLVKLSKHLSGIQAGFLMARKKK